MARKTRVHFAGARHHVMNRGVDHQPIFRDRRDRRRFLDFLADASREQHVEVLAYCLMGNHFHLLVHTPEDTLAAAMRHLCGRFAAWFNHRHQRDGPLFRGRYRDQLVHTDRQLLAVVRYIHRNPLEIGEALGAYPWSSHLAYTGPAPSPAFLDRTTVLRMVGGVSAYEQLVCSADPPASEASDQPEATDATLGRVDCVVATITGADLAELRTAVPGRRNTARLLAIAAAARHLENPERVAAHYSLGSIKSVRTAQRRAHQAMAADVRLRRNFELIGLQVGPVPT